MPKMMPIIVIPKGTEKPMCKELNISRTALYAALNFSSQSEKAQKVRDKALADYGGFLTKKPILKKVRQAN